jgi:hypothetical protein
MVKLQIPYTAENLVATHIYTSCHQPILAMICAKLMSVHKTAIYRKVAGADFPEYFDRA